MFERAERGAKIVQSVTLLHARFDEASPLSLLLETLGRPCRTDAPTPHSDFVKAWYRNHHIKKIVTSESSVGELFVFKNAGAGKKREVLVWTLAEAIYGQQRSVHYAYLLQVVDL